MITKIFLHYIRNTRWSITDGEKWGTNDALTGVGVQPKVDHSCLLVQAVCDRSTVRPEK